jgi:hypothetical protein
MRARRIKLDAEPLKVDNMREPFTTRDLVSFKLASDQRFNGEGKGIRAAGRIEKAVTKAGKDACLEPADFDLLRDSLENPQPVQGANKYPLFPAHRLLPMIDDIVNATEIEITAAEEAKPNGVEEAKPAN